MKTTIHDIAKKAKVSIATVSRVLNNDNKVKAETKNTVLKVIKELDYQHNHNNYNKDFKIIGLIVPNISNPFHANLIEQIERAGEKYKFHFLVCNTENDLLKEERHLSLLKHRSVDGIISASNTYRYSSNTVEIVENFPFILMVNTNPNIKVNMVTVDDYLGAYTAVEHFIKEGHEKIACIIGDQNRGSDNNRKEGYLNVLHDNNIQFQKDFLQKAKYSIEGGKAAAKKLFSLESPPTAIFTYNELIAAGTYQAAKEENINIPEECSVIGADNTLIGEVLDPPLTTISHPIKELGLHAVELLVQELGVPSLQKRKISLTPELVIRKSTKILEDTKVFIK